MNRGYFLKKIVTCLITGITVAALLLTLGNSGNISWFPPPVVFSLVALSLLLAIIFPFVWQAKERKQKINSVKYYGFFYALIRYCIAFNTAAFGWKKVFGLQFVVPIEISKLPMNQQSGEWLTWYYFGHSFTFGIIIALIQIGGAYMLMFRNTLLPGAIMLFAFMLNLMLINIFYQMNAGALVQSVVLTIGILFLIMLHYKELVAFFLKKISGLPSLTFRKPVTKNLLRLSVIIFSLLFTIYIKSLLK